MIEINIYLIMILHTNLDLTAPAASGSNIFMIYLISVEDFSTFCRGFLDLIEKNIEIKAYPECGEPEK